MKSRRISRNPNPTRYTLTNCASDGAAARHAYPLKSENVTATMSLPRIGEEAK